MEEWYNYETCRTVAYNGHLHILQYAHENHLEWNWDSDICSYAAYNGHFHILQYAHINGCEWDESTCYSAAYNGHLQCLRYALENNCNMPNYDNFIDNELYIKIKIIDIFVEILTKKIFNNVITHSAATTIQNFWRRSYYDPQYKICKYRNKILNDIYQNYF